MTCESLSPYFEPEHRALEGRLLPLEAERLAPLLEGELPEGEKARAIAIELARSELFALAVPKVCGGTHPEADVRGICLAREVLARIHSLADHVFSSHVLGSYLVAQAAEVPLKSEVLARVTDGSSIGAFAATEPETGSSLRSIASTARRTSQAYFLNGRKSYVASAGIADFFVVFARTGPEGDPGGLTAFYVPRQTPGLEVTGDVLLTARVPIGELVLRQCRVPRAYRLGAEGAGMSLAQTALQNFRPTTGAAAVGVATRALEETVLHLRTTRRSGRVLGENQALRFAVADMATEVEAARTLVYRAAWSADRGTGSEELSCQAHLFAVQTALSVVSRAVGLAGARGVRVGETVERLAREVQLLRFQMGTGEVQRIRIARSLLGPRAQEGPRT